MRNVMTQLYFEKSNDETITDLYREEEEAVRQTILAQIKSHYTDGFDVDDFLGGLLKL